MAKNRFLVGAALLASVFALSGTATAQDGCTSLKDARGLSSITIRVDDNAVPEFDCIKVKLKKTTLTWEGSADAAEVLVVFKAPSVCKTMGSGQTLPDKPGRSGKKCKLDKSQHKTTGDFCYSVVVIRSDGQVRSTDPRLIIDR